MPDSMSPPWPPAKAAAAEGRFVSIPARARDEIGELAFYLDQVRQNLLTVNAHISGSSRTMPSVLRDLKDIVKMTEAATVRVLEEAEALLDEGHAASAALAEATDAAGDDAAIAEPLARVQALAEQANGRVLTIMSALEFQDLTSQKIHRAFEVLEEVGARLGKIHGLVWLGGEGPAAGHEPATEDAGRAEGKSGQDLADEILLRFQG